MTGREQRIALAVAALLAAPALPAPGATAAPAGAAGTAAPAAPAGAAPLGKLEQESLDDALAGLGLKIDPAPAGKIIGQIHVVSQEVFSRRDWWFQFLNHFHRTSRSWAVARELLVAPGEPYDQTRIEESIRYLQSPPSLPISGRPFSPPELSSIVAIVPVVPWAAPAAPSPPAGTVDLLVVTRDVWSLRFNTTFEFQQNTIAYLATSLSENNLFGWRKYLAVGFVMDQGAARVGPTYFDPNIRGTRLTLLASASAYYARDTRRHEGQSATFSLRYPLYSLASRWGAGLDMVYQNAVARVFRGNSLRLVDVLETPADPLDDVPYIYRRHILTIDGSVVRSFGERVKQRVTFGYRVDARRSELPSDFDYGMVPVEARDLFLAEFAPVSERRSEPYLRYEMFTPRYAVYRNLDTFDLRENKRLGPSLTAAISYGLPALGADHRDFGFGGAASWAFGPGGGYGRIALSASARLSDRYGGQTLIDQNVEGTAYAASPLVGRFARLVLSGTVEAVRNDTFRTRFFLGGSTGLRGYAIGDFIGTRQAVGHAELRTAPLAIFSQRFGALLFYEVGDAADSFSAMVAHHDFGAGLRWLIPQLNSSVWRIDWAFATHNTAFTRAGFPGRVTIGIDQAFGVR